jgi:creatinine amidohydrolase
MGYLLEELTWPQVQQALEETQVVVIPTGSIEQHGPHMPVGTDYLVAKELAARVGRIAPVIVAPAIPVGYADYHADFPGTLSLCEETLTRVYEEMAGYFVSYGATHIVFLNGHGGNLPSLLRASGALRKRNVLAATILWWEAAAALDPEWSLIGHGDFVETSLMLAINEAIVDLGKANPPVRKNLSDRLILNDIHDCRFESGLIHVALRTRDYTDSGDMIEYGASPGADHSVPPTAATAARGEKILAQVAQYTARFVEAFSEVHLSSRG